MTVRTTLQHVVSKLHAHHMRPITFPEATQSTSPDAEAEGCLLFDDAIRDCNQEAATLLRCTRTVLIGAPVACLWQAAQPRASQPEQAFRERIAAAHAGLPQTFRWRVSRADQSSFDALIDLESVQRDGHTAVLMRMRELP